MTRRAIASLALLLAAAPCLAEVSVDHGPSGPTPFFEPGPRGAWDRVSSKPGRDVLNELGDTKGDGWPSVASNQATAIPEVVWSGGGTDSEIYYSRFTDAYGWSFARNLSRDSATDEMPVQASDEFGNTFIAWARSQGMPRSIQFTGLSASDCCQIRTRELSRNLTDVRRPTLAVAEGGTIYAAYEEHLEGADQITYVAIDRIVVPRASGGVLRCGGEDTIDIARQGTIRSHRTMPAAAVDARVRAEGDEVWVTWIDATGSVGFVQLMDGVFTAPEYRTYSDPGGDEAVREEIRLEVLAD